MRRPAVTTDELIRRVHILQDRLWTAGASSITVCEIKPMEVKDVTPYNMALHEYLCATGDSGNGCRTQIRRDFLKPDGFHVQPRFLSILFKQYACAILGLDVPCPTPMEDFVPSHIRRQYEIEFPGLTSRSSNRYEGREMSHGWIW